MYYRLQSFCRLVKGATRGAIYNFQNGKVYSINNSSVKLLEACADRPLDQVLSIDAPNAPMDFLHKLTEMGLGSFFLQKPDLPRRQADENPPEGLAFLWLELTSQCNNRCLHCYAASGPSTDTDCVPHERWLSLVNEACQAGASAIQLIGGEPLLYPKWREIVIAASKLGLDIEIFTNATLIDDSCVEFFRQYNVHIATTLCGSTAQVHDQVTLRAGSFDQTVAAVKKLTAASVPVRIASVIIKNNEHDVENIIKMCFALGCMTVPDVVRPTGRGDADELLPLTYHKPPVRPPFYTDEYTFTRAQCWHNCLAGKIAVTSSGDVIPCIFARNQVCGNILTASLAEILESQPLKAVWQTTKDHVDKCKDCEYRYACIDCRPLAQGSHPEKKWLACSTNCAYNPYTGHWNDQLCPVKTIDHQER